MYDSSTLEVVQENWAFDMRNRFFYYQTASHSFGISLAVTQDGKFTGLDLGDNYPRGIRMYSYDKDEMLSKEIYYFKTRHGTEEKSPAQVVYDRYDEISTSDKSFYKWSNDNDVYTELGASGFIETDDGYIVFFLSETPSLDNQYTGEILNTPRNLGFTKISKDLQTKLSPGIKETGGFFTFNGAWTELTNEGISYLTDFKDLKFTLSRLKNVKITDKLILLLFEIWDPDNYSSTGYMIVDTDGNAKSKIQILCYPLRLFRADDPLYVKDGSIFMVSGESDGRLSTYKIDITI